MNPIGIEYLTKTRVGKLSLDSITEFDLMYCDKNLKTTSLSPISGDIYNHNFKDSIILPVRDLYGKVIGYTCRKLNPKLGEPKQRHSTFDKSDHLYNLYKAWPFILKEMSVILVEGPFDCISLWSKGFTNCVALLGTSLSDTQINLIARFTKKVYIMLDADVAGKKFSRKILENLKEFGIEGFIVNLDKDPDEVDEAILKAKMREVLPSVKK